VRQIYGEIRLLMITDKLRVNFEFCGITDTVITGDSSFIVEERHC